MQQDRLDGIGAGDVEHDAPGEPPRQEPKLLVGRPGHVGKETQRLVRPIGQRLLDGRLVENAEVGRNLVEVVVLTELTSRRRLARLLGQLLLGLGLVERAIPVIAAVAPEEAQAFPALPICSSVSSSVVAQAIQSSSMISSGVR